MVNKHMKRYSTSYIIKGLQIKTTVRYHNIPIRMAKSRKLTPPNAGEDVMPQELSFIAGGMEKLYSHFEKQFDSFLQN